MSNHNFDRYSLQQYLQDKEQINADEVWDAFCAIANPRTKDIILKYIEHKIPRQELADEYHLSRQRIWKIYDKGIKDIKKRLGLIE